MAYATYEYDGRRRVGRVDGDELIPLDGLVELGRDTPDTILKAADELPDEAVPLSDVRLLPVVPAPDKIICVGLNYQTHVGETGREQPTYPVLFTKFAASLIGPGDDIVVPAESQQVDFEGELAVVIGRTGRRVPAAHAAEYVLGYCAANDVTMRDYQYKTHQWLQGKTWDRSTPLGPYLVPAHEVDPTEATVRTVLNGQTLQSAPVAQLIFDIPTLIATLSEFTTLLPGDVILTGTPAGVGYRREPQVFLRPGDEISVAVSGVGTLVNRVRAE